MCAINGSEFSLSNGDEAGTAGGVASGTFIKESTWITYSFDVTLEGQGACRLTDKMFQNHNNAVDAGGAVNPPISGAVLKALCELMCGVHQGREGRHREVDEAVQGQAREEHHASEGDGARRVAHGAAAGRAGRQGRRRSARPESDDADRRADRSNGPRSGSRRSRREGGRQEGRVEGAQGRRDQAGGGLLGGPVGEGAMALWTAYDIVTIIPDLVKIGGGLITHIGDLKFPGDSYRNGAYDLYQLANNGKPPVTLTPESCKC